LLIFKIYQCLNYGKSFFIAFKDIHMSGQAIDLLSHLTPAADFDTTAIHKPFQYSDRITNCDSRRSGPGRLLVLSRLVKQQRRVQNGRWSAYIVSFFILIAISFFQDESNSPSVVARLHSMTLAASTWMFATLGDCCAIHFGCMLNECKGASGAAPSGLWFPGS